MKLALAFLAALALTHAALDKNTIQPYNDLHHPFSTLFRPDARGSFRIIGGQEVAPHSLPYQVFLRIIANFGESYCGGSIVSPTTVLTVAHCAEIARDIFAVFGLHDLRKPNGTQLRVDKIIIHPAWNGRSAENDIAIRRFDRQIELNENINIVKLPTRADISNDFAGETATASGWGMYSKSSYAPPTVLHSIDVSVITNEECNQFWNGTIPPTQICTSTTEGKLTCHGDSGGPLVANGKQIGITCFQSYSCEIGIPVVYIRITEYIDWIEQNSDVVFD